MVEWKTVKHRTASDGDVKLSSDGSLIMRTGSELPDEISFQQQIAELGYPVPEIVEFGVRDGMPFFIERSLGSLSLHDIAVIDNKEVGVVRESTVDAAIEVSAMLLEAQLLNAATLTTSPEQIELWFKKATYIENVFEENPDLNNERVSSSMVKAMEKLRQLPLAYGHMDYGMPNAFPSGVIDWQHHGPAPVGYDVYPMLDITAFKGGNRGYAFTREQRRRYITVLETTVSRSGSDSLQPYMDSFLFVKSLFFLALMRPADENDHAKHVKWQYRRKLFSIVLDKYESSTPIDTAEFPTLAEFGELYNKAQSDENSK